MIKLTEKEILQDALITEKFMVNMYDQFLKEASCMPLLDLLLEQYEQLCDIQHKVFLNMKERDFYPVENAEMKKINEALTLQKQETKKYDFK